MQRLLSCLMTLVLMTLLSACTNSSDSHAEGEDHEHGPGTHTHGETTAADTAGTYVDSTSVFFDDDGNALGEEQEGAEHHEGVDAAHEHGPDTHTHDDDHE